MDIAGLNEAKAESKNVVVVLGIVTIVGCVTVPAEVPDLLHATINITEAYPIKN